MNLVDTSGWLEYLADTKNAKNFAEAIENTDELIVSCLLYTSPSPRDRTRSRMPSSA